MEEISREELDGLAPGQRRFVQAIAGVLPDRSRCRVRDGVVLVDIPGRDSPESDLTLTVTPDEVVISGEFEHWHHARDDLDYGRVHPWDGDDGFDVAAAFVEQLVADRIEVEVVDRYLSTRVTTWWLSEGGKRRVVSRSRTVVPNLRRHRLIHRIRPG